MTIQQTGHCKHGTFNLADGCTQCIAERREGQKALDGQLSAVEDSIATAEAAISNQGEPAPLSLVKVQYYSTTEGQAKGREYTYFTAEPLTVGDMVDVPVGEPPVLKTAIVTELDVPEAEIEAFRDRVKTIPVGSRGATVIFKPEKPAPTLEPHAFGVTVEQAILDETDPNAWRTGEEETRVEQSEETPEEQQGEPILPIGGLAEAAQAAGAEVTVSEMATSEDTEPEMTALIRVYPDDDAIALYREGQKLLEYAKARVITTNEDLKPAADDLAIIRGTRRSLEAHRVDMSKPIREYLNKVNDGFKRMLEPFDQADQITSDLMLTFSAEQERKAAEAQQIEDEKFELAQREAAFSGTGEHTQELETIVIPPEAPKIIRTGMGTVSGRKTHKARVVDFALLSDEWKIANQSLLDSHARTTKGERPIPGVEFYIESGLTVRTKQVKED